MCYTRHWSCDSRDWCGGKDAAAVASIAVAETGADRSAVTTVSGVSAISEGVSVSDAVSSDVGTESSAEKAEETSDSLE
ncbi:hypothetical protein IscW_ISCW023794 [Ixodes scapularis]|uniref:Uncharacterized protein n=1 Tax=Ixodes scapularis TaxID=6945 RepID=B7QHJ7_IXOSC|nr:hypothetical protein IscW_ISCW023794 [Ixodes scapularis]|eukprot:XP_002414654.1 hypothetical protein IscW_ISCW023794 [Ixodes scapularis]